MKTVLNALRYSHNMLNGLIERFPEGNFVDATLGNGNDLYKIVTHQAFTGKVYGFDIQHQAISTTQTLIDSHPLQFKEHYQLIHDSHAKLANYISEDTLLHGGIFNLGYLPGGNHFITTRYPSTIEAISQISKRLVRHGQIIIVVYSGHPEGHLEKNALLEYLSTLPHPDYQVLQYNFINQTNSPPMTFVIEKQ